MVAAAPQTDPETAAANRRGEMTPQQRQRMSASLKAAYGNIPILAGCFGVISLFILVIGVGSPSSHFDQGAVLLFGGLFAICLVAGVWSGLRLGRALGEAGAGHVEQASGLLVWDRGYYRAAVPGRKLDLAGLQLGAGTYKFYFLPGSGRVVAAELLAAEAPAQAQAELQHTLAVTNGFNVDWLPDFRQGRLGAGRAGRLQRTWLPTGWVLVGAVVILAVFMFLVKANPDSGLLIPLAIVEIFLAIGVLIGLLTAIRPTIDLLAGRVLAAEGPVQKVQHETHGRNASVYYYYQIGSQLWSVSPDAYRALLEGARYRIYYLPREKSLVGIEPTG